MKQTANNSYPYKYLLTFSLLLVIMTMTKNGAISSPKTLKSVKCMDNELMSGGQGRQSQIIKILSSHDQCEKLERVPGRFVS